MAYTYSNTPKNPFGLDHDVILCLTPENAEEVINNKWCKIALCKLNIENNDTFFCAKLAKLHRDCLMLSAGAISSHEEVKILLATEGVIFSEIGINSCKVLKYTLVAKDVFIPRFAFKEIFFYDYIYIANVDFNKTKEYDTYQNLECNINMQYGLIYRYKL